jgi:drug/metabolite transporter (DMT)-like permease
LYLSNIIFAAIIGMLIWSTPMTWGIVSGICLTIIGAIFTIRAQSQTRNVKVEKHG